MDHKKTIENIPENPGVYLMLNALGEVIYVGKAKNLKNRVRQYFTKSNLTKRIQKMVGEIRSVDYIITQSERDAFILELNLIKSHMPYYNVMLKDGKTYPYLRITTEDAYPRLSVTRKPNQKKSNYFGPYPQSFSSKRVLNLLQSAFMVRTCKKKITEKPERPCLNYHIKLCSAPCANHVTKQAYQKQVEELTRFLEGKNHEILEELIVQMNEHSENTEYEKAALIRDKIRVLRKLSDRYMLKPDNQAKDVFAFDMIQDQGFGFLLHIRDGQIKDRKQFAFTHLMSEDPSENMIHFLTEYYMNQKQLPNEIILYNDIDHLEWFKDWLEQNATHSIQLTHPLRGDKRQLAQLAYQNAKMGLETALEKNKSHQNSLKALAQLLELEVYPQKIEAYDISTLSGKETVGAMTVFHEGKPDKSKYRKFALSEQTKNNDVGALTEVVKRRMKRINDPTFGEIADLILVDGGKQQVNAVVKVLKQFNQDLPVCGMVKDDHHRTRGLIYENKEFEIKNHPMIFPLIGMIQEETHRFAIAYNRKKRQKKLFESELDQIMGLGAKRKQALLNHFGSLSEIKGAGLKQLIEVKGISKHIGQNILNHFQRKEP